MNSKALLLGASVLSNEAIAAEPQLDANLSGHTTVGLEVEENGVAGVVGTLGPRFELALDFGKVDVGAEADAAGLLSVNQVPSSDNKIDGRLGGYLSAGPMLRIGEVRVSGGYEVAMDSLSSWAPVGLDSVQEGFYAQATFREICPLGVRFDHLGPTGQTIRFGVSLEI